MSARFTYKRACIHAILVDYIGTPTAWVGQYSARKSSGVGARELSPRTTGRITLWRYFSPEPLQEMRVHSTILRRPLSLQRS